MEDSFVLHSPNMTTDCTMSCIRVIRGFPLVPLYAWQRGPFISLPPDPLDSS
jgi:hypothetical protein